MLNMTRKTPSKLDDYIVLLLGLALFAVPLLRIFGIVSLSFDYFEVVVGGVLPIMVALGKWVMFVRRYLSEESGARVPMPDPITALLVALSIFHFLPMWQVSRVVENTLFSNLWLFVMSYFLSAAALGRYLWPLEFFSLVFGAGESVARSAASMRPTNKAEISEFLTPEVVEEVPLPEPLKVAQVMPVVQSVDGGGVTRPSVNALMPKRNAAGLIDDAIAGDPVALSRIIEALNSLGSEMVTGALQENNVHPGVQEKILAALAGEPQRLLEVMRHPAFAQRQRAMFEDLLS